MSKPITSKQIQELRERLKSISPLPWETDGADFAISLNTSKHKDPVVFGGIGTDDSEWGFGSVNDAEFVVAACNLAPAMLDEIERLRKVEGAAQKVHDVLSKQPKVSMMLGIGESAVEEIEDATLELRAVLEAK